MEILVPKFKRDPNAKVESLYSGVASNGRTVTTTVMASADRNHLVAHREYGPALPRGQGGRIAVLVLGGMETTLDEMHYILEAKQQKKFVPRRGPGEVADMCRLLLERRNDAVRYYRANPSEAPRPRPKKRVTLHLPVGFRYVPSGQVGLNILARV